MKLRPLGDRVILKYQEAKEKTKSGIILPDSAKEKPQEAMVAAVGSTMNCEGKNLQMQVKEGDFSHPPYDRGCCGRHQGEKIAGTCSGRGGYG